MKHNHLHHLLKKSVPSNLIELLQPFIGETRLNRIEDIINKRIQHIHLAIEAPANINNALAAIRTAESLGIFNIHLIACEQGAKAARVITQGALYWVNIHFYNTLDDFLKVLSQDYNWPQNMMLAGAALNDSPVSMQEVPVDKPLCLLIGNEQRGLSQQAMNACQICYRIPMAGMSQSFNLSVAAAISLYDTTLRKRMTLNNTSDLNIDDATLLRAKYMLNSVDGRLAEELLNQTQTMHED
jgi:tRNA (guanosine-2'-O-)-methyltransferase